jgi:exopolysaccharide biosynthesis polyprenyl glycosylphosphotransferase
VLGGLDRLDRIVSRAGANHLLVAVSRHRAHSDLKPHLARIHQPGVAVQWVCVDAGSAATDLGSLSEIQDPGTQTSAIAIRPNLARWIPSVDRVWIARRAKRMVDFVAAGIGLLLLAPLLLGIIAALWLTTGRPIFYTQERIGQGGRRFRIVKFRSMRNDAESATGPIWASDHDSRCTRVGGWLRRTNLDELPQLYNVLRGDMSLVGPRPERPMFVDEFRKSLPDYDLRHSVPGGMTGWAQVHGWRGRTSLRKRLQYDLDYIQRWSFWLDFRVLSMTVQHVLWNKTTWGGRGRRGGPLGDDNPA